MRLVSYADSTSAKINYITYSSINYPSLLNNTNDSTIIEKIDVWYLENVQNKQDSDRVDYASCISDEVFCNVRTFSLGIGFLIFKTTICSAYYRIYNQKNSRLSCGQQEDKFTVSEKNGNGELTYSVEVFKVDETAFADGVNDLENSEYYLYTSQGYWMMPPTYFASFLVYMRSWYVHSDENLSATSVLIFPLAIRSVIHLKMIVK